MVLRYEGFLCYAMFGIASIFVRSGRHFLGQISAFISRSLTYEGEAATSASASYSLSPSFPVPECGSCCLSSSVSSLHLL
uniref:Uncharacterized protein n=1 Tax=Picea sitchensis TaxID=3332 RepID=A0A6B9XS61_PICSI|nr:hypothetical protein Q903MT_gene6866 [Picea sitchensis]